MIKAIKTLNDVSRALKAGEEISNPTKWKENQATINSVYAVLVGIVAVVRWKFPEIMLPDEYLMNIAIVLTSVLALINRLISAITTKKIGFTSRKGL